MRGCDMAYTSTSPAALIVAADTVACTVWSFPAVPIALCATAAPIAIVLAPAPPPAMARMPESSVAVTWTVPAVMTAPSTTVELIVDVISLSVTAPPRANVSAPAPPAAMTERSASYRVDTKTAGASTVDADTTSARKSPMKFFAKDAPIAIVLA